MHHLISAARIQIKTSGDNSDLYQLCEKMVARGRRMLWGEVCKKKVKQILGQDKWHLRHVGIEMFQVATPSWFGQENTSDLRKDKFAV